MRKATVRPPTALGKHQVVLRVRRNSRTLYWFWYEPIHPGFGQEQEVK